MSTVIRETGSGLLLAEQAQGEPALRHALKQIDDRYVLQQHGPYWKVLCVNSWDREDGVMTVLTWMDTYGNPLPLSSGILDEVQRWRPEARGRRGLDADQRNAKIVDETRKQARTDADEIVGEHRARLERGQLQVSLADVSRKPAWLKERRGLIAR